MPPWARAAPLAALALAAPGCRTPHYGFEVKGVVSLDRTLRDRVPLPAYLCVSEVNPATGRVLPGGLFRLHREPGTGTHRHIVCAIPEAGTERRFDWSDYGPFILEDMQLVAWLEPAPQLADDCADYLKSPAKHYRPHTPLPKACTDLRAAVVQGRAIAFARMGNPSSGPPRTEDQVEIRLVP